MYLVAVHTNRCLVSQLRTYWQSIQTVAKSDKVQVCCKAPQDGWGVCGMQFDTAGSARSKTTPIRVINVMELVTRY